MMTPERTRYGDLDCYELGITSRPDLVVVLCHGYGAPGHDLLGVVFEWIELLGDDASKIRFICPVAPQSLAEFGMPQGRAWWPLNMAALMDAAEARKFEDLHQKVPPGIDDARSSLESMVQTALAEFTGTTAQVGEKAPLVIGGFSQGAMLTMDTTLRGQIAKPEMLIQFSGTVVCQQQWQDAMPKRLDGVNLYQSHGNQDPILPFESACRLRDLLGAAKVNSTFHEFVGPHTIDSQAIADTAEGLRAALKEWAK